MIRPSGVPTLLLFALLSLLLLLAPVGLGGCAIDTFQDSISTRVEVPALRTTEMVTATKRFRFERDVGEAKGASLHRAWVQIETPSEVDLSFISSVDVYVVDPTSGTRVLAVSGTGFAPGEQRADLEILLEGDVKRFISDQRVTLEWEIMPNLLYRQVPTTETVALRFGILLEIDT